MWIKIRRRPIESRAIQFDGTLPSELSDALLDEHPEFGRRAKALTLGPGTLRIDAEDGRTLFAERHDFVVFRDNAVFVVPCGDFGFDYERIEEPAPPAGEG